MSQRSKFLLLVAIFLLPTMASFIVFYYFPPEKSGNYGELVSPVVALPAISSTSFDGIAESVDEKLRGKWLIVTRDSGSCGVTCQKKLYAMRQTRLILGRDQDRVVLVVLADDDVPPSPDVKKMFLGTVWVAAKKSPWLSMLPVAPGQAVEGYIYAIDPLGNLFIRYSADPDIKRMSRDIQRVLKASQIG